MIMNADYDETGQLTDKGELVLKMAELYYQHITSTDGGFSLGSAVSVGTTMAGSSNNPYQAGYAAMYGDREKIIKTRATVGGGQVTIGNISVPTGQNFGTDTSGQYVPPSQGETISDGVNRLLNMTQEIIRDSVTDTIEITIPENLEKIKDTAEKIISGEIIGDLKTSAVQGWAQTTSFFGAMYETIHEMCFGLGEEKEKSCRQTEDEIPVEDLDEEEVTPSSTPATSPTVSPSSSPEPETETTEPETGRNPVIDPGFVSAEAQAKIIKELKADLQKNLEAIKAKTHGSESFYQLDEIYSYLKTGIKWMVLLGIENSREHDPEGFALLQEYAAIAKEKIGILYDEAKNIDDSLDDFALYRSGKKDIRALFSAIDDYAPEVAIDLTLSVTGGFVAGKVGVKASSIVARVAGKMPEVKVMKTVDNLVPDNLAPGKIVPEVPASHLPNAQQIEQAGLGGRSLNAEIKFTTQTGTGGTKVYADLPHSKPVASVNSGARMADNIAEFPPHLYQIERVEITASLGHKPIQLPGDITASNLAKKGNNGLDLKGKTTDDGGGLPVKTGDKAPKKNSVSDTPGNKPAEPNVAHPVAKVSTDDFMKHIFQEDIELKYEKLDNQLPAHLQDVDISVKVEAWYKLGLDDLAVVKEIRKDYIRLLDRIKLQVKDWYSQGDDLGSISLKASQERRNIGETHKNVTPEPYKTQIRNRNIEKYQDPLGPTFEKLLQEGNSLEEIIKQSCIAGGKDLSIPKQVMDDIGGK